MEKTKYSPNLQNFLNYVFEDFCNYYYDDGLNEEIFNRLSDGEKRQAEEMILCPRQQLLLRRRKGRRALFTNEFLQYEAGTDPGRLQAAETGHPRGSKKK